jgi:hypothetical protein
VDSLSEIILARQVKLRREMLRREANVEAWAASSCWDIKISYANYFALAIFWQTRLNSREEANNIASCLLMNKKIPSLLHLYDRRSRGSAVSCRVHQVCHASIDAARRSGSR